MIMSGLKLTAPWLTELDAEDYILRLGYKGVGYQANADEAEYARKLYKIITIISLFTSLPILIFSIYFIFSPVDVMGFTITLLYLSTFVIYYVVLLGLEVLFFTLTKRRLTKSNPINGGQGYWVMKAKSRTRGQRFSKKTTILLLLLVSVSWIDMIFFPVEPLRLGFTIVFSAMLIDAFCITKYGSLKDTGSVT